MEVWFSFSKGLRYKVRGPGLIESMKIIAFEQFLDLAVKDMNRENIVEITEKLFINIQGKQ
jgi:hypothetical protein